MPAIPYNNTDVVDKPWDGPGAEAALKNDATASVYRQEYAWVDPDANADTKGAYKFPHHEVSADGTPGAANVNGVRSALSRLGQAATQVPEGDKAAVKDHLQKHLDKFDNAKKASADDDEIETTPADDEDETPKDGAHFRLPRVAASVTAAITQEHLPIVRAMVQMPSAPEARVRAQTPAAPGVMSAG